MTVSVMENGFHSAVIEKTLAMFDYITDTKVVEN